MKRPLTLAERVQLETDNLDGADPPLSELVACTLFLSFQVIDGYPTARSHVLLRKEDDTGMLVIQVTMTVPLEEIPR